MTQILAQWGEFEELNQKLRENIKLMANNKKKLLSVHKDDVKTGKKEIDRLYDETCKIFAYLKSLHQKSLIQRETARSELKNLCQKVDEESLGVKNFEYEQLDTLKQIAICDDYNSHKNEPKLVSKKEFYENNPHKQTEDIHHEKSMRLQYELQQRKELQNDLREITQSVKTLSNELTEKERFVNSLQSKIGNVFEAIKPLQKYMNLPSVMIYPNESEIDGLPSVLFAIYQSFITQIHCDNTLDQQIKIKITKRTFDETEKSTTNNHLEDGEIGPPHKKQKTNHHKRQTINIEFKRIGIELEFMYCFKYNLVLIAVKRQRDNTWKYEDPTLFMDLFDGHSMIELPADLPYFAAFSWAQELSGCYLFAKNTDKTKKRDIINLNTLQFALKCRKESMISLQNQIKQLKAVSGSNNDNEYNLFIKHLIDKAFEDKQRHSIPKNKLLSFKLITDKSKTNDKYKTYFELILERKAFSLHCVVEIGASYPNHAPLFFVKDIFTDKVKRGNSDYFVNESKNIEIKLNGDFNYVSDRNKELLLSMMIYKMQIYFDIYVESNKNSCLDDTIRIHRGRDRRQQF